MNHKSSKNRCSCVHIFIEARALHRVNDGKLVKDEVGHYTDKVETPAAISHVDAEILQSGTAILPGRPTTTAHKFLSNNEFESIFCTTVTKILYLV